ncbi:MAG: hypothetical protein KatS3mg015_2003 [Fimbriimonadales bacterium]|nr:MAG: hypothetical protein KatS3mg015_2003 [Fimbriimonadales bacterium]
MSVPWDNRSRRLAWGVLFLAVSPCVVFSVFLAKFFIWPPEPQYEILARQKSPDGSLEFVLAKESTRD